LRRVKGGSNNFFESAQPFRSDDLLCQNPLLDKNRHKGTSKNSSRQVATNLTR